MYGLSNDGSGSSFKGIDVGREGKDAATYDTKHLTLTLNIEEGTIIK